MLQNIREKFTGWVAITILAVIGVTFVFVGGANFVFVGNNYAAKVDDIDIGIGQFEAAYQDQLQQNPQLAQVGPEIRGQVRTRILEQLIQQRVIDNYIDKAGYRISDSQVTALIQRTPAFQVDGKFDMNTYLDLLATNGYVPAAYESAQRVTLRRSQLQFGISDSAFLSPAAFRRYLNLAGEQRLVRLATIDPESVAAEVVVTDEMIAAFYDDNPTLFQLPESVDIEYIEIQRSEVAQGVSVTEEDLLEYYEFNKDRYEQDEQRQSRHILILADDGDAAAEAQANELLARINAGESFEDLAREYSADTFTADRGGDLGALTRSQMPDGLDSAVFSMAEGDVQGPIRTDFGFHLVRLDSIIEPGPLPLDQVRGELTTELQDQQAESLFLELERKLSDALFDATDLASVSAAVGVGIQSAAGFTRDGGEHFGGEPAVIDAVFNDAVLSGGQLSEIVEIDGNRSAIFAVTNHYPATREALEDVSEEVRAALEAQQAEEIMAARADRMIAALDEGMDFVAAAEASGATAGETTIMSRGSEDADQSVTVAVFTALKPSQDEPTTGSTRNGLGGYTVYSVEAVIPGSPESMPVAQRDAGKGQLTDQTGLGDFIAFVQALREDAEVIINEDVLVGQDLL
ncbi:MAG: SurA N-terminal domain-containing protein [Woeseiaceae bacterium]|jgi:peptidyl-prolyl cis-trans isomerase D